MNGLGRVQRRIRKRIKGQRNPLYKEQLRGLGLFILGERRFREDLNTMFQYLKWDYKEDEDSLSTVNHMEKMKKRTGYSCWDPGELAMGRTFFTMGKISNCSSFSRTVVNAPELVTFNSHLGGLLGKSSILLYSIPKIVSEVTTFVSSESCSADKTL